MLASKSERDALGAVLFFNVAHYVLRPWPWILVALASIVVFPELSDLQRALPHVDPGLIGHDIAYPAMLKFLPTGFIGLMVGGLIAANSSTILTHLNWGASYLVHDFYRQFVRSDASERHYVVAARLVTVLLFVCSSATVYLLDTAKDAFDIILQIGAGTGLLYLVRWFWWRVNAWCEIVAMVSSFAVSVILLMLSRGGSHQHARRVADHDCGHDRVLGARRLPGARDRPGHADGVLSQGPSVRPGLGGGPPVGRSAARRGRPREHSDGAARLGDRLRRDLVCPVCRRQLPLRPIDACPDPYGDLPRLRLHRHADRQPALEGRGRRTASVR